MHEFLMIGAVGFYGLLLIEMIVVLALLEYEQHFLSFVSVLIFAAILYWAGNGPVVLTFVAHNPVSTVLAVIAYILIGVAVAIGKWWLFSIDILEKRRERLARFFISDLPSQIKSLDVELKRTGDGPGVDTQQRRADIQANMAQCKAAIANKTLAGEYVRNEWKSIENYPHRDGLGRIYYVVKPDSTQYKPRIVGWIAYWPPVLVWSLINDPLRRLANYMYHLIKDLLNQITEHAWRDEP